MAKTLAAAHCFSNSVIRGLLSVCQMWRDAEGIRRSWDPRAKPPGCEGWVAVIIPAGDEPRELSATSTILLAATQLPLGMPTNRFLALFADKHREQDRDHDAIRADVLCTIS
jgi:hypothetical protein